MPLKIIKIRSPFAMILWITLGVLIIGYGFVAARSFFVDTLATHLDIKDPASRPIIDTLTQAAPDDPNAHLLAGVYYERTFDVEDLDRSLAEYERAAELEPYNFMLWLAVAGARDRIGDTEGAGGAYARALDLAPNYSSVQWAYGNFLIRQGRGEAGYPLVAKAATSPNFAGPAVSIVFQMADGDVGRTRDLLGNTPAVNATLIPTLSSLRRYGDAVEVWAAIPLELRQGGYRQTGQDLMNFLLSSGLSRAAAYVATDLAADEGAKPTIGQVTNGGFEDGIKLPNDSPFEWKIGDGTAPQIGLSEAQKHSGRYGLTMVFNSYRTEVYRNLSQQIAVEPGARYRLQVWYKSNLKTDAKYQWQLIDAATAKALGATPVMSPIDDWTSVVTEIQVPNESDGIRLVLIRSGCTTVVCPATGNIVFDDISLTKE